MMVLRHLQYLTALARERHFAQAAAVCYVTQPTLSAGIKQLEESLDVLIVERGQRFLGLTAQGERVLAWAQRVLVDYGSLQQELSEMREGLVGQLRIGAIPVALPMVPLLTAPFATRHERTDIIVLSQTSISIQRGLDEFSLDVGVTYLDNEPLARVRCLPLYQERYVLLTQRDGPFSRAQRRHLVGGGNFAVMPADTRHAKPPHSRHALSRERCRNSCRCRNQLLVDPLVPPAPRSLVEHRAAHLSLTAE
jgi:DNA-binding transcriptional LysR family regulator